MQDANVPLCLKGVSHHGKPACVLLHTLHVMSSKRHSQVCNREVERDISNTAGFQVNCQQAGEFGVVDFN